MEPRKASYVMRFILLTIALSILALGSSPYAMAATTVAFPVEDAVMPSDFSARDYNYGALDRLHVGSVTTTYTSTRRSIIRFKDIASTIGPGQVITSATMYLNCVSERTFDNFTVSAYRVLLDWGEGNSNGTTEVGAVCTNYAKYTSLPWNAIGCGAASDSTGEDSTADRRATPEASTLITGLGWFSWDVTTAAKKWYSGEWSEYGLVLISNSEGAGLNSLKEFASSEGSPQPYLEVTYYPSGPGTTLEVCATCTYTTIQDALADAVAGDTVKVTDGATYHTTSGNLILMKTGVDLVSNADVTGVTPTINGGYRPAVSFVGPLTNCTLDRFIITGGGLGSGGQIDMDGTAGAVTEVTIQNCLVDGSVGNVGPAIRLAGPVAFTVRDCRLLDCYASCIVSPPGHEEVAYTGFPITIEGCEIQATAPSGLGGSGIRIIGDGSGAVEVSIGGDGDKANWIHDCRYAGIRMDDLGSGSSVTIDNNTIEGNGFGNTDLPTGGIYFENVADASITRNTIRNNRQAGVAINGGSAYQNVTIGGSVALGNAIYGNDMGGISFATNVGPVVTGTYTIQGNNIYNNARGGVFLARALSGTLTVTQNDIHDNTRGGIAVRNNCEVEITKNHIRNNGYGGIRTGQANTFGGTAGGAVLTIRQNKIHGQQSAWQGGGMDVRHASGVIENNLVYKNGTGGIRFGDYIGEIKNNTVVDNGQGGKGGGIVYHDPAGGLSVTPIGTAPATILIRNNICTDHPDAGLRVGGSPDGDPCPDVLDYGDGGKYRDYNLLYANYPWNDIFERENPPDCGWPNLNDMSCVQQQYGGCGAHFDLSQSPPIVLNGPNDMMTDPAFVAPASDNYHLESFSPAKGAGDDLTDLGAYGGVYPLVDGDIPEF